MSEAGKAERIAKDRDEQLRVVSEAGAEDGWRCDVCDEVVGRVIEIDMTHIDWWFKIFICGDCLDVAVRKLKGGEADDRIERGSSEGSDGRK